MRVGYVTTYDPRSPDAFSGTGYFIARSLEQAGLSIRLLGPLEPRRTLYVNAKRATYRYLTKKHYDWRRDPIMARRYAAEVSSRLERERYDVVFSPDTIPIAHLEVDRPIVTWTDATFLSQLGFYPGFDATSVASESVRAGITIETEAIRRASLILYTSDWAARSALTDFGAAPEKVEVVPYGANLHSLVDEEAVSQAIDRRPREPCRLLFIGVDWERKGATTAIAVADALNRAGLSTELTIVGSEPPIPTEARRFVNVHGFLAKSEGDSTVADLLARSHFLILPSRAETYGIVLCEANAYGVPCLTTRVGGIPTVVRDGVNGLMFDVDAPVEAYVSAVTRLFDDFDSYRQLAQDAHHEYRRRLNWSVAGTQVRELLERLLPAAT